MPVNTSQGSREKFIGFYREMKDKLKKDRTLSHAFLHFASKFSYTIYPVGCFTPIFKMADFVVEGDYFVIRE